MRQKISEALRLQVSLRAHNACEYCLVPEAFLATVFHIDHIRSLKHRGKTNLENLALACPHCNQNKGTDVATFIDDESENLIRLFNPRKDVWSDNFEINYGQIIAKTIIGDATIKILDFNQIERIMFRQELIVAGFYPLISER